MLISFEDYIEHIGTPRHSGRYPWGSGGQENIEDQRNRQFLDYCDEMKKKGLTDSEVANGMGLTRNELQQKKSLIKTQIKQTNIAEAQRLKDKGTSPAAIAQRMGVPDSTVRSWLAPGATDKAETHKSITDSLKSQVDEKGLIDVGKGVENHLGVTKTKLDTALAALKEQGYTVNVVPIEQLTTGHDTKTKVLGPPGTTQRDAFLNRNNIQLPFKFSDDGGRTFYTLHPPIQIDPKRIQVVYGDEGGNKADGVMYIRPNVNDLSLGGKNYAQVRVAVGDKHYMKGMALYKDDLPDGVDIQFHTAKKDTGNKLDIMKETTADPVNPFKSVVRQIVENPGTAQERVTSALNIVSGKTLDPDSGNVEGRWKEWANDLSAQMLSKQDPALARSQLDMTYERRQMTYDDIKGLTNPTVRKRLLEDFAGATDSSAVHLEAAALPRQGVHVIFPIDTLKATEVYAPNYNHGEKVVLIRHPHGGTFEIPELTVNKRHADSRKILGLNPADAIGINSIVAKQLSGADFDGDTVAVIPNNARRIKTSPALERLKDFDPVYSYPGYPGMPVMKNTQTEMGMITNLITDMSLQGAPMDHIARAIKHSMVVIDAENKGLDHKRSYNDNGIKDLKLKYQGSTRGGASTLISRSRAKERISDRKLRSMKRGGHIDRKTGALVFEPAAGRRTIKVERLSLTPDARTLLSTHPKPMERLYATHSNKLKALANQARLDAVNIKPPKQSSTAKKVYAKEIESLNAKLALAERNAPLERQANVIASTKVKIRRDYNPNMEKKTLDKIKYQEVSLARLRTGASKTRIEISQEEWNAIQAGAISNSKLNSILDHANMEIVHQLARPKNKPLMTSTAIDRAKGMYEQGYTRAEVAKALGVSVSTLDAAIQVGEE